MNFAISGTSKQVFTWLALKTEIEAKRIIERAYEKLNTQNAGMGRKTLDALYAAEDIKLLTERRAGGPCPWNKDITRCDIAECAGPACQFKESDNEEGKV